MAAENTEPAKLHCLICDKELDWAMSPSDEEGPAARVETPPSGGVIFTSRGNYGSKVYDQGFADSEYLSAVVCDECLLERKERVLLVSYHDHRDILLAETWTGTED